MSDSSDPAAGRSVVVIADDDPDIRHLVGVAAGRAGLLIGASVGDGQAALRAIRDLRPDLAILDVAMPGLTGLEVCRSVREDAAVPRTVLMLLTADVQDSARTAGLAAGADSFMPKPFSPRMLVREITSLLSMAHSR